MRQTFTHYYVQAQGKDGMPEIVYHTVDKKKKEYYHLFLDKKRAVELLTKEKKLNPDLKYRIVKSSQTYQAGEWQ